MKYKRKEASVVRPQHMTDTHSNISKRTVSEHALRRQEYLADRQQYRRFRNFAFFGIAGFVLLLLTMFALWLRAFGTRVFGDSIQTDPPHAVLFLTPIVVLASLVVVSLLPMVRFVFHEGVSKDDAKDRLTIWQAIIKELADVLKHYVGAGKSAG